MGRTNCRGERIRSFMSAPGRISEEAVFNALNVTSALQSYCKLAFKV